jgi:hypothetical protein
MVSGSLVESLWEVAVSLDVTVSLNVPTGVGTMKVEVVESDRNGS